MRGSTTVELPVWPKARAAAIRTSRSGSQGRDETGEGGGGLQTGQPTGRVGTVRRGGIIEQVQQRGLQQVRVQGNERVRGGFDNPTLGVVPAASRWGNERDAPSSARARTAASFTRPDES